MLDKIRKPLGMSENQCRMTIIYFTAFIVQSIALLFLTPKKFRYKIFLLLMTINLIYNTLWIKFFSD